MSDKIQHSELTRKAWSLAALHAHDQEHMAARFREQLLLVVADIEANPQNFVGGTLTAALVSNVEEGKSVTLYGNAIGTNSAIHAATLQMQEIVADNVAEARESAIEAQLRRYQADGAGDVLMQMLKKRLDSGEDCDCEDCVKDRAAESNTKK